MDVKTRHANKRGFGIGLLIGILLFALCFFLVYKVGIGIIYRYWLSDTDKGTENSQQRLYIEINNMVKNETSFPIYITAKKKIKGFVSKELPNFCKDNRSCICICAIDSECESPLNECLNLNTKLFNDFEIRPRLDEKGKPKTFNCKILKQNNRVNISCF